MVPVILLSSILAGLALAVVATAFGATIPIVVAGYSLGGVLTLIAILVAAMLHEVEGEPAPKPQELCGDSDFPSADCARKAGRSGQLLCAGLAPLLHGESRGLSTEWIATDTDL